MEGPDREPGPTPAAIRNARYRARLAERGLVCRKEIIPDGDVGRFRAIAAEMRRAAGVTDFRGRAIGIMPSDITGAKVAVFETVPIGDAQKLHEIAVEMRRAAGVTDRRGGHDIRPTVVDEYAVAAFVERISARMAEMGDTGPRERLAAVDAEIVWLLDQAGWTQAQVGAVCGLAHPQQAVSRYLRKRY